MKNFFWNVLKYGVSLFCLVYAFRDVPLVELWKTLKTYPLLPMGAVVGIAFAAYLMMALRLSRMTEPGMSFKSTFSGTLVCLALNNVLPAKAGEIAKAAWIGRSNDVPFQKGLALVLVERFFDVNVLAVLSLWFLWQIGEKHAVVLFVLFLAMGWGILALFRLRPRWMAVCLGLLGKGKLRDFAEKVLSSVIDQMAMKRLAWMALTSLAVWVLYSLNVTVALNEVAGLNLSWDEALSVFAVSSLGMLLPSSPGAFGVYEAMTMTALKHHGIAPEEALAVALFMHMAQFIPVTLVGGLVFTAFPQKPSGDSLSRRG